MLDAQVLTKHIDVFDETRRVVLDERAVEIVGGIGRGVARTALIKDDNAVEGWVEEPAAARRAASARTAVEENRRHPVRVSAHVIVYFVAVTHVEKACVVWLYFRVEVTWVGNWAGDLVCSVRCWQRHIPEIRLRCSANAESGARAKCSEEQRVQPQPPHERHNNIYVLTPPSDFSG